MLGFQCGLPEGVFFMGIVKLLLWIATSGDLGLKGISKRTVAVVSF